MIKKKFFFLLILHFTFLIFHFSIASAIEVGGHLTENTTWSPANNPYHVIDDVYVDNNVTLTILPGTVVKFNAAPLVNITSIDNYFVYYNGSNTAKMLWVDGRVIANGTEEEPITFTRIQDSLYYHWGIIYLREEADLCNFKYCDFKNSALMLIVLGIIPRGAISIYNEGAIIENCNFIDNLCGIFIDRPTQNVLIKNNYFYSIDNICPTYPYYIAGGIHITAPPIGQSNPILVANNTFSELNVSIFYLDIHGAPAYVIDNQFFEGGIDADMDSEAASYIYNNNFLNCSKGISGGYPNDSLYIKKNNFIGGYDGININYAYIEISDNYFEGCDLDTDCNTSGLIYNNKINNGSAYGPGIVDYFNNISYNHENGIGICATYQSLSCTNNISINNQYAFEASDSFDNCIFFGNEELEQFGVSGNPIFRNCIIDFPLDPPLIDGGGNIIVDSLQAQTLFEDISNGDFHLSEGSPAIDSGFDTLSYYYPFDMDYNHRVWDGDNNGSEIIDIGPYEYNSPSFGGIEGITYNTINGNSVDYVLIKIDNELGEFTFSDSIGSYQYRLPVGVYDAYAVRVFYDDAVEYQIEVIDGEFTQLDIAMCETVNVQEHEVPRNSSLISHISNYPNPFNPNTTISFSIQEYNKVELSIFNIKGQKVATLLNEMIRKGKHSIVWSGIDKNNKPVCSGIYLYKIKVGSQETVKRMLLLK